MFLESGKAKCVIHVYGNSMHNESHLDLLWRVRIFTQRKKQWRKGTLEEVIALDFPENTHGLGVQEYKPLVSPNYIENITAITVPHPIRILKMSSVYG